MLCDAHIHLFDLHKVSGIRPVLPPDVRLCASSHSEAEFIWQEEYARSHPAQVVLSFGIHPQRAEPDALPFLETLVREKRIQAIGECGFDLFDASFRETEKAQKLMWDIQLDMAIASCLPLVIHCRKALPLIFADSKKLKRVSAVVFHGWPGSLGEAESLLARGINARFSVGKGLLRGDRSLRETVAGIPLSRLLTETDAPYMTLRGQSWSEIGDIRSVALASAALRGMPADGFLEEVEKNFIDVFGVHRGLVPVL